MKIILTLLNILAYSCGNLFFPDQVMQAPSTIPSTSGYQGAISKPNLRPVTYNSYSIDYPQQYSNLDSNVTVPKSYQAPIAMQPVAIITTPVPSVSRSPQEWFDYVNDIIIKGILRFTLSMEKGIYEIQSLTTNDRRQNIVFSPVSLTTTLAIVLAGSAGRTFQEVSKVLGLEIGVDITQNSEVVHQMLGRLLNRLLHKIEETPGPRLDFATAAFVQDGYPILSEFKELSTNVYKNEVLNVDYIRNGQAIKQQINAWVKQKTRGKITSILDNTPDPTTTIILLSALYFNGEWSQPFLNSATRRRPFFVEPNETIEVNIMYNGGTFPFFEDKQLGVKILALPYKGHETSMYVLLPKNPGAKALQDFQNQLTADQIESLINNMKNESCIFGLPRMKLSTNINLAPVLANLGLSSLFDPARSDLSLISQGRRNGASIPPSTPNRILDLPTSDIENRMIDDNNNASRLMRRNYFTYEDKERGLTVEQWSTGYSISKTRSRRDAKGQTEPPLGTEKSENSYSVDGSEVNSDSARFVNLERNKYQFQEQRPRRTKRNTRPINPSFLNFMRQQNFNTYGLDALRNSSNLINPHLYVSQVLHKVEIDVTETGTEAAAVTGAILERGGNQKRLIANRPFIFFIRHNPTKLVLFWATLNTPTPNYPAT